MKKGKALAVSILVLGVALSLIGEAFLFQAPQAQQGSQVQNPAIDVNQTSSPEPKAEPVNLPNAVFGLQPPAILNPQQTFLVSANDMVWESLVTSTKTNISLMNFVLLLPSQSFNSSIAAAVFLNGTMVHERSFQLTVVIPQGKPSPVFDTYSVPIVMNSVIPGGTTVTVALLPQAQIYLFSSTESGQSSIAHGLSVLPNSVPKQAAISQPLFFAWGSTS